MGGNTSSTRVCGNSAANASNTPNTPPEAPTVGAIPWSSVAVTTSNWTRLPVSTEAKYRSANRREPIVRSTMLPNAYSAYMLSAMCATPPCRNAEVMSCQSSNPTRPPPSRGKDPSGHNAK